MKNNQPAIDEYLFEEHFEAFRSFVQNKSGISFTSFSQNPYVDRQESYKYDIYRKARDKIVFESWKESDIGSGDILDSVIESIEIQGNNLVQWDSRHGDEVRPHHQLHQAKKQSAQTKKIERLFFDFYRGSDDEKSFKAFIDTFGKKYSLIAYLFFIKDKSRYLPISPKYFDNTFEVLGVDFKTSHRCSWENYCLYIEIVRGIQSMLINSLCSDVSLLDAHSFAWIISSQMAKQGPLADIKVNKTEREAITKSRIGQSLFRNDLINYWNQCAVTGCKNEILLKASHIKPWSKSDDHDRLNPYNGLLLSPDLDECFDSGLISFNDKGGILLSKDLTEKDMQNLGITVDMKLSKIEDDHKKYLSYHREHIFKT